MEAIAWVHKRIVVSGVIIPRNYGRKLDEAHVLNLMESIKRIGLINPIRLQNHITGQPAILVAGLHRLEACKRLGWESIPAHSNVSEDKLDTALAHIDENLLRVNLSPAEEAKAVVERARLVKAIDERDAEKVAKAEREAAEVTGPNGPMTSAKKNGGKSTGVGRGKGGGGSKPEAGSDAQIAKLTGRSKKTVGRARKRGENIAPDVLEAVVGTVNDTPAALDALASKPVEEQRAVVASGVSVLPPKQESNVLSIGIRRAQKAWNEYQKALSELSQQDRDEFLRSIGHAKQNEVAA